MRRRVRPHGDGTNDLLPVAVFEGNEGGTVAPASSRSERRKIIRGERRRRGIDQWGRAEVHLHIRRPPWQRPQRPGLRQERDQVVAA